MVPIDREITIVPEMILDFQMQPQSFYIPEMTVLAQANKAGGATSSTIGRAAIDHMQAVSLDDVMALLPGGLTSEPNLTDVKPATIRSVSASGIEMNSLGTSIIHDGAPMSNNANLSVLSPTRTGTYLGAHPLGNSTNPTSGIDLRTLSTDNIESVEVIRGIPSVEHGDFTSGMVIINSKAGREPLRITGKLNPKVYMGSLGYGFSLGERRGAMNINADFAHNTNEPVVAYSAYRRLTVRSLYTKDVTANFRSNTSLNLLYGSDRRQLNPDDEVQKRNSKDTEYGLTINTNGAWNINHGILRQLKYIFSATYTSKQSYYRSLASSYYTPYSMTTVDGTVLSNFAGQHIFDADGLEITRFTDADKDNFAYCLPYNYLSSYNIDSREVNIFSKLALTMFRQAGMTNHRMLLGVDFRSDGNLGHGKTFNPTSPPEHQGVNMNANYRPRDYRDIPFINQVGFFAEENFSWQIGLTRLDIRAGLRYDHASVVHGILSPRLNASFEILPDRVWIRGGWGRTAKMPTLLYLYPEKAYFEYININELLDPSIPEGQQLYITTTRVQDVGNRNLKIATNDKAEVGFDLRFGSLTVNATAFQEKLRNGYGMVQTCDAFSPFEWITYQRDADNRLQETGRSNVLSYWRTPGNNLFVTTRDVELEINSGRIDRINTSFALNGAYMRASSRDTSLDFYDPTGEMDGEWRKDIAIYSREGNIRFDERLSTTLRVTHNIPRIGFVITLSGQTVWKDANWGEYGHNDLPKGYMSLESGRPVWFDEGTFTTEQDFRDAGMGHMLKVVTHPLETKESYRPYFCFNMNVTKEIGRLLRVSFFANNMFRSYPRRELGRRPGSYVILNNRFYFGIELALTI